MKTYHVYNSVKDYLDNTDNYFVAHDLTEKDFEVYEALGKLVTGPVTVMYIKK